MIHAARHFCRVAARKSGCLAAEGKRKVMNTAVSLCSQETLRNMQGTAANTTPGEDVAQHQGMGSCLLGPTEKSHSLTAAELCLRAALGTHPLPSFTKI